MTGRTADGQRRQSPDVRRRITLVLALFALVMALALVACGQKEDNSGGETKDDQTQTDGQTVDLRAAYEAAIKQVQEELGDNAPVLLEETAVEILNSYYPGLENAKLKQSVFFISPTATSCENG